MLTTHIIQAGATAACEADAAMGEKGGAALLQRGSDGAALAALRTLAASHGLLEPLAALEEAAARGQRRSLSAGADEALPAQCCVCPATLDDGPLLGWTGAWLSHVPALSPAATLLLSVATISVILTALLWCLCGRHGDTDPVGFKVVSAAAADVPQHDSDGVLMHGALRSPPPFTPRSALITPASGASGASSGLRRTLASREARGDLLVRQHAKALHDAAIASGAPAASADASFASRASPHAPGSSSSAAAAAGRVGGGGPSTDYLLAAAQPPEMREAARAARRAAEAKAALVSLAGGSDDSAHAAPAAVSAMSLIDAVDDEREWMMAHRDGGGGADAAAWPSAPQLLVAMPPPPPHATLGAEIGAAVTQEIGAACSAMRQAMLERQASLGEELARCVTTHLDHRLTSRQEPSPWPCGTRGDSAGAP